MAAWMPLGRLPVTSAVTEPYRSLFENAKGPPQFTDLDGKTSMWTSLCAFGRAGWPATAKFPAVVKAVQERLEKRHDVPGHAA